MSSKHKKARHKRTKACAISKKTKQIVARRDGGSCIFCGRFGLPEAHVIPRSQGGLGCAQNIITVCRECHDKLDNSTEREKMLEVAIGYLRLHYPNWKREHYIFDKWQKDKAKTDIKTQKASFHIYYDEYAFDNPQKDKGVPPDGFRFIEQ